MQKQDKIVVENDKVGDVLVLRVSGRVNVLSAPELEKEALHFIRSGCRKMMLDFNGVSYVSSAGLRTLLFLFNEIKAQSGKLVVCSEMPGVVDIVRLCGLHHVIFIVGKPEGAMQFLGS